MLKTLEKIDKDMKDSFADVKKNFWKKYRMIFEKANLFQQMLKRDFVEASKRAELLKTQVEALREELNGLKKGNGRVEPPAPLGSEKAVLDDISTMMNQINEALAKLPASNPRVTKSVPASGTILLANHYGDTMTFQINDKTWVVPAKSTILVGDVPAGTFSYKISHAIYGLQLSDPAAVLAQGRRSRCPRSSLFDPARLRQAAGLLITLLIGQRRAAQDLLFYPDMPVFASNWHYQVNGVSPLCHVQRQISSHRRLYACETGYLRATNPLKGRPFDFLRKAMSTERLRIWLVLALLLKIRCKSV